MGRPFGPLTAGSRLYRIDAFDMEALVACRESLLQVASGGVSMEEVAGRVVGHLFESFRSKEGERACALVRFYKTHRFNLLPHDLQEFARRGGDVPTDAACLTLLGSAGIEPTWNDPRESTGHRAIPLTGDLSQAPMIAALIGDLGIDRTLVLDPPGDLQSEFHLRQYNVFYVADAPGSAAVPAQEEFVLRYGIHSVVGFGGVLASGDMFAVILFTTARVPEIVLPSFRTLALTVKTLIVPHTYKVFDEHHHRPERS